MELNVEFGRLNELGIDFDSEFDVGFDSTAEFTTDFGALHEISASDVETYRGDYIVEPDFTEQVLATKNKMLTDNVKVSAIEVQRVSNTSGGRTVYIGGLING